jgi:DNA segregation ATPase FtsK/SpoIIIE-like protein
VRGYVDQRRREKARREVIAKHTKKGSPPPDVPLRPVSTDPAKTAGNAALKAVDLPASPRAVPPVVNRKKLETPSLLPDPEPPKAPAQRKPGTFTLPPLALLDAPKVERKIDERELMDLAHHLEVKCSEFSVEGQVAQIHPRS